LTTDHETGRLSLTKPATTIELAGSVNGYFGLEAACIDGERAASAALQRLGLAAKDVRVPADVDAEEGDLFIRVKTHPKQRDFVDFDEDLQVKDLQVAVAEGYRDIELVKRFTTHGMGPSQGRHSAPTAAQIVAKSTGRTSPLAGITTVRPPFRPEYLGALAGNHRRPERRSPLHQTHLRLDGRMRLVSSWWRAAYYGHADEAAPVVAQEVRAVRERAGLFDVSPLGKIEIRGNDAGLFLDRLYTMSHANQPIGRTRYCLMLNETGAIIDDGVACRLAKDRFYVTTTTGAVSRVHTEMLFWNTQWQLDVDVLNLTTSFGALNITGPHARSIVAQLESDLDFDAAAFKYLDGRQGHLAGVPVLAMRIGFTGEASYEFHCPASLVASLWASIMAAGAEHGLRPYGLETSRVLRLEKGHILIGQDTDAMTTPQELGFGWAVSKKKLFFVGKRSIEMRARLGLTRRLVGLRFPEGLRPLPYEGCLVLDGATPVGVVTSAADSPTLGHGIALAYVRPQDAQEGAAVTVRNRDGRVFQANVVLHAFVDPKNTRQSI
jgi:sarcosine oxidase subunit alpha